MDRRTVGMAKEVREEMSMDDMDDNFEALESQFTALDRQRMLAGTRDQAEMAAAFYQKLRERGVWWMPAMVITACHMQAFVVGTIMKPKS